MVASAVAAMVMAAVAGLQYISARTIVEIYPPARARSARMTALNQIRLRLADAKIGSCAVSMDGSYILFTDPNIGANSYSLLYFSSGAKTLYYVEDLFSGSALDIHPVAKGPIDINFTLGSTDLDVPNHTVYKGVDAVVTAYVRTTERLAYSNIDDRDGETVIHLRNP